MFIIVLAVGVVWVCHCSLPRRGKFTGRVNEFIGRAARVSEYSLAACPSVDCIPSSRCVGLTNPLNCCCRFFLFCCLFYYLTVNKDEYNISGIRGG